MSVETIIERMKSNQIVDVTINGKVGIAYFDRTPTNLYRHYDMRLKVNGEVAMTFDEKNLKQIESILAFQKVSVA